MAKKIGLAKIKLPSYVKKVKAVFIENALRSLAALIMIALIFAAGRMYVANSGYFRLKTVETKEIFLDKKSLNMINSRILNWYKGTNIFRINLRGIARTLAASYPDAKAITVSLELPDKLVVSMKFRRPVALVRSDKFFPVDSEGFIMPSVDPASVSGLSVIEGVTVRYDEKKGKRSASKNLRSALELLRDITASALNAELGKVRIDAADSSNLLLRMANGIEVRIGAEKFKERLDMLYRTLKDPRLAPDRIEYIDLRFDDAVIGPK